MCMIDDIINIQTVVEWCGQCCGIQLLYFLLFVRMEFMCHHQTLKMRKLVALFLCDIGGVMCVLVRRKEV